MSGYGYLFDENVWDVLAFDPACGRTDCFFVGTAGQEEFSAGSVGECVDKSGSSASILDISDMCGGAFFVGTDSDRIGSSVGGGLYLQKLCC